jgi:hypothetical protein
LLAKSPWLRSSALDDGFIYARLIHASFIYASFLASEPLCAVRGERGTCGTEPVGVQYNKYIYAIFVCGTAPAFLQGSKESHDTAGRRRRLGGGGKRAATDIIPVDNGANRT